MEEPEPIVVTRPCEDLCGSDQPHLVVIAENFYRLRCLTCRQQRTPRIQHALGHRLGAICALPSIPPGLVMAPTKTNCPACRRLTEQKYASFPSAMRRCRHCAQVCAHERHASVTLNNQDRLITTCTQCHHRYDELGPTHLSLESGTACGLKVKVRTESKLIRTNCPLCLSTLKVAPTQETGAVMQVRCLSCMAAKDHIIQRVLVSMASSVILTCITCGERRAGPPILHWEIRPNTRRPTCHSAGGYGFARRIEEVTCGECLKSMLAKAEVLISPDWRPSVMISEDHYAL